ncbi:TAFII55 protein conserved region-domain-containing protein [Rhizophagus diaphanus]|nr:TAFII55 protein conserved region-domain-containing protein [Rhizophagus diaphanus] [Rhizophagus sp. MUCL 43196]
MGRPRDSKKNIPSPTTTSVTGSSKSSAPLKIKIPRSEALLRDKQKRRLSTGTKKRPIILGKIPEDDDIEEKDIPIEEQFILRLMVPEDVKQKFREKVKTGKFTDDIGIIFKDPRRAIFTFENQKYRAKLVDLPCIIEAQKTFNKIQYYKVADICQMLVVESQIQDDEQLFTENSKSSNVDEFEWPDGLTTPPLKNVRKRRFRKRISAKKIEDIEKEVEKLLHEDSLAEEVKLVWEDAIDSETATPAAYIGSKAHEEEEQEEVEEVQGEEDDYDVELEEDTTVLGEEILDEDQFSTPDDDLQKEFENALERFDEMSDSSDKNDEEEETTESEESTSESDEDEDEDPELTQILNKREELTTDIAKLEEEIKNFESHFASAINPLIQERLTGKITTAKEDLSQKQQEIETGDKRIAEIQERMKAQVAELKRLSKEKMKGKRRESDEDSENETENENSSEEDDDEQNEEENKKDDKQEEDKDSKKDDSMFLLGEDEFYEEELNNKDDDDDGDNKEEILTVDNEGQDENEGDIMDIEDDDKEKSKEGSEKSQRSNDEG